jgi:hypothetical protein
MNQLPITPNINNNALASVFNYTSATYKFYWFLALVEEIESSHKEIQKEYLFSRMIANAWYPVKYFRLSFGSQDHISLLINDFFNTTSINVSDNKKEIRKHLLKPGDPSILKKLYHLDKNVPHKFLSPWFKGSKKSVYESSQQDSQNSMYRLFKNKIVVNDNWYDYIRLNAKLIKDYIYWNLALFIQARNPSTPDVINKLIKPAKRNTLTKQRNQFWSVFLKFKPETKCIFTKEPLQIDDYHVDHFIPYSFVSHDLIWNLVPINSSFNNSKSNRLPPLDKHFDDFYNLQSEAIKVFGNKMPKKFKEEYLSAFPNFEANKNIGFDNYKDVIAPLVTVAHNNGFEYMNEHGSN